MRENLLVRMIGEFEVYQFMENIEEFTAYFKANQDNFSIFEIATLSDVEKTEVNTNYTVYDMTLANSGQHFWLLKDESTGMYEPVENREEVDNLMKHLDNEEVPSE